MADIDPSDIECFPDADAFVRWLGAHDGGRDFVWLRFHKKQSGVSGISKDEAIDAALCQGWVDGQIGKGDETSWLVRFSPRKPRSKWSKINTERAERLVAEGRMRPAGLAEVEAAKADGRWDEAYAGQKSAELPDDLVEAIAANPAAQAMFDTLNSVNRYALYYRVTTAKKPETRQRRIADFVAMLARGDTIHPQKGDARPGQRRTKVK